MPRPRSAILSRLFLGLLVLALVILPLHAVDAAGTIRYARPGGMTTGSCSSWANACELRRALAVAISGNKIWAAKGTYKPAAAKDFDRTKTFALKNGVSVFGGFAGGETSVSQRKITANVTILSGDIHLKNNATDNSYHVVTANGVNVTAVLDGFTIRAGNANGDIVLGLDPAGGGIYNKNSSPTLRNLVITANAASNRGGGMYNENSSPVLTNVKFTANSIANLGSAIGGGGMYNNNSSPRLTKVTFTRNNGANEGGGMVNANASNPILNNVTFSSNAAIEGGGMSNNASSPVLTNVSFVTNQATGSGQGGGGMYNNNGSAPVLNSVTFNTNSTPGNGGGMYNNNSSHPSITNVTFSGNQATGFGQGGGMANVFSSPTLNNVTFSGNSTATPGFGGGVYNENSTLNLYNTILWGDGSGTAEIVNVSSLVILLDSVVQGAVSSSGDCLNDAQSACTHVINTNPVLGALHSNGGFTQTRALGGGSSAVNTGGLNFACAPKDQRGIKRPQGPRCDIGAYEKK